MMGATGRFGALALRVLRLRETAWLALAVLASAIFEFRLRLLMAQPYPPSGDAGGDLYNAHAWLGHGLPALSQAPLAPPLYSFAIVVPFTTLFPTFEGVQIYMAFVPAILVVPAYLLVRESGAGRWASVFGAGLLAISAIWSLMVTWNAAYNLFGIFFLLFFLAFLVRYLREPSWRAAIFVAIPFALVGLSHQLTFLVALFVLLAAGAWLLWVTPAGRIAAVLRLAVPSMVLGVPLLFLYGPLASSVSTAGGGSSYLPNIYWAFQVGPFFSWGYQGVKLDAVVLVDLLLSFGSLAFLSGKPDRSPFAVALAGVLFAATLVILLDPGNAARGLYFLPIPFMAAVPVFLEQGIARRFLEAGQAVPPSDAPLARWSRRVGRSEEGRAAVSVIVIAFAIALLLVNTSVSQNVMTAGIAFNDSLQPNGVAALSWIRDHTPSNATFADGAGLQTWMWGYAERMDYAPVSLNAEVTQQSLTYSEDADLINLGSYLLSNPYWVVSSSYPSGEGTPQIYLATPGFWEPFLGTEADHDTLLLNGSTGPRWVDLQFANLASAAPNGSAPDLTYDFSLSWATPNRSAELRTELRGPDIDLNWLPGNVTPIQVNYSFGIPPSGYFFTYGSFPSVANASSVTDQFSLNGVGFSVTFTGGRFTQELLPSGWGQLWYWGGGNLSVATSGMLPQNSLPSRAFATAPLIRSLKIDYAIVDLDKDYAMFARLRAGVFWNGPAVQLYQTGDLVVFGQ